MLDLALFGFVMALFVLGLRRPFIWVLAYLYIDVLAPQKIGWALVKLLPVSFIAFLLAFAGWAIFDDKKTTRFTVRQGIMALLLVYCFWTTQTADFPVNAAAKWEWVWRALVFAIFLPLTLTTRLRIEAALLTLLLSASAIVIAAGIKTAFGGGGYGNLYLFVNDNSNIYESSTLAMAAIAIIPIALWFTRHGTIFAPDWRVKIFAGLLIFACLLIPIGTEARTGLLCIAVLGLMLLRDMKRRVLFIGGAAALALLAVPFLPQSFTDRMATIEDHSGDQSASTRVAVWQWTMDYATRHPFGGGFDAYRGNSFKYRMPVSVSDGRTTHITTQDVEERARAYHSSIFEMLGEQGYPGLAMWLLLHLLGLWQMEKIRRGWRGRAGPDGWQAPLASALQYAQVVYLVGATFQGIAYQPFILMLIGAQIALATHCARTDSAREEAQRKVRRATRRAAGAATASGEPAMP